MTLILLLLYLDGGTSCTSRGSMARAVPCPPSLGAEEGAGARPGGGAAQPQHADPVSPAAGSGQHGLSWTGAGTDYNTGR